MQTAVLALVALAAVMTCADAYTCTCKNNMCTNIPTLGEYYLTSFCDASVACGTAQKSCYDYYSADYSRFGCGATISCCCQKNAKCNNLKVIDGGPACSVENKAGGPVIDASYSMCQTCTGGTSCGWSDHIRVTCSKKSSPLADYEDNDEMLGPCSYLQAEIDAGATPCAGDLTDPLRELLMRHERV